MDYLVEEIIHPLAAKRHLIAHRITLTALECRDCFLSGANRRLLASYLPKAVSDKLDFLLVFHGAHADGDHCLFEARCLHHVLIVELTGERLVCLFLFVLKEVHVGKGLGFRV